jgi:hypothetical protein
MCSKKLTYQVYLKRAKKARGRDYSHSHLMLYAMTLLCSIDIDIMDEVYS